MEDLKFLTMNRPVQRGQVERLKEIIRDQGYNKGLPIIVDKDGNILDGQHRYVACKELGIEPEIIVDGTDAIIPLINSSQLRWSMKDYINFYAGKGFPDYIILDNLCKAKKLSPGIAYNIIYSKSIARPALTRKDKSVPLKDGTFKFPDHTPKYFTKLESKIDKILNLVNVLGIPRTDRLVIAISKLAEEPNFSFATMIKKLDYQKARVYRCSTITEYVNMLSDIYNHKNSKKVLVKY